MDDSEGKSSIKSMIEELRNANIGPENFKEYMQKINEKNQIVKTNIDNLKHNYHQTMQDLQDLMKSEEIKELIEKGFIKYEAYQKIQKLNEILNAVVDWKSFQNEFLHIMVEKLSGLVDTTEALKIKSEALNEFREQEKSRQQTNLETISRMAEAFENAHIRQLQFFERKLDERSSKGVSKDYPRQFSSESSTEDTGDEAPKKSASRKKSSSSRSKKSSSSDDSSSEDDEDDVDKAFKKVDEEYDEF